MDKSLKGTLEKYHNDLYWAKDELSRLLMAVEERRHSIERIEMEIRELGGDPDDPDGDE